MAKSKKEVFIPKDAGQYKDDFQDILSRFEEGYAPIISCGSGWYGIITDLHRKISEIYPDYRILQIKEKYGGLRFYFEEGDLLRGVTSSFEKENPYPDPKDQTAVSDWWKKLSVFEDSVKGEKIKKEKLDQLKQIEKLIKETEALSLQTCESCGDPGKMREWRGKSGLGLVYRMTRCNDCWEK